MDDGIRCGRCKQVHSPDDFPPSQRHNGAYCRPCKRARERAHPKKPFEKCSRCRGPRTGAHPAYCPPCFKAYKAERLLEACGRCGKVRPEADRTNSAYCYECWRDWWLRRKYGLTGEQYEQMLARQGNRCALCACESNGRTWHVDHCHTTKRVRGLLCDLCNRGLGHFRDNSALLRRAIEYLEAPASI